MKVAWLQLYQIDVDNLSTNTKLIHYNCSCQKYIKAVLVFVTYCCMQTDGIGNTRQE